MLWVEAPWALWLREHLVPLPGLAGAGALPAAVDPSRSWGSWQSSGPPALHDCLDLHCSCWCHCAPCVCHVPQGCWYWLCSLFSAKCPCTWWEIASPTFPGPGSKSPKSGAVASRAEPRRQPRLSERQSSRMRTCQRRSSKILLIAPLRPW